MKTVNYQAEPTAQAFHASDKVCRGFLGCVGNGKSVTCITEIMRLAYDQWPNNEGIRKTRWAIIRNTNPELRTTTLNTWKQWIPESICPLTLNPVIMGHMVQPIGDGTTIDLEVYFLALDRDDDVRKLLSLELTGVFINEAREMSYSVVKAARERIGRFPSLIDGYDEIDKYDSVHPSYVVHYDNGHPQACKRKSLLMDTNPPDDDHWWFALAEMGCLKETKESEKDFAKSETARIFDFFRGPSPLIKESNGTYTPNPLAENINHLPGGYQYYLDMIAGNDEDHINVMVMGNYGHLKTGRPVYPEYNDKMHCPESGIIPIKGLPIALGWDFGLTPSCIIGQLTSLGQLIILDELFTEDMHVRQFARDVVKPHLSKHYKGFEILFSLGDPAGNARGEGEGRSAIGVLNDDYIENDDGDIIVPLNLGFDTEPAPTNDPTLRLDAVSSFLIRLVDGGYPGFVLNKTARYLRKGFMGGYKYKKIQVAGSEDRFNLKPDKNVYSHPHDGLQYLALGYTTGLHVEDDDDGYESHREAGAGGY